MNYLLTKVPTHREWADDAKWLAFVIRQFGQQVLIETLRRLGTYDVSAGYFYVCCRNVAAK